MRVVLAARCVFCFFLVTVVAVPLCAQDDPIAGFIEQAASVWTDGGEAALTEYIHAHPILVGAAVARLLDVAIEVGDAGNADDEKENTDFAGTVARLYEKDTGSSAATELVEAYRGWGPDARRKRAAARKLEADAKDARNNGDLPRAEQLLLKALSIYETIGDRHSRAIVFGSLGVVYWYAGDFDGVIEHYQNALEARREVEDRILEGRTLNGLGSAHRQKGDIESAAAFYEKAVALRRQTGDLGGLGTSLTYLGDLYQQMGRGLEARALLEEALPVLEQSGKTGLMADILTALANLYSDIGRQNQANASYRRAIGIARAANQPAKETVCRMNLATNLRLAGRYNEALEQLDAAKHLLDDNPDPAQTAVLHKKRGLTYIAIGELDRAKEDLLEYVRIASDLDDTGHNIDALINIGYLYQKLGAYDRALKSAARARALAEKADLLREVRETDALAAELEWLRGRPDAALQAWRRALERDRADGMSSLVVQDRLGMANAEALAGNLARARERFRAIRAEALALAPGEESAVDFGIGHTFERENPDSAASHYERALEVIERTRRAVGAAEVRTGFLSGERRFLYEEVARYYASLHLGGRNGGWSDRAFETVERAKARGLLELLEQPVLEESTAAEDALLDSIYQLQGTAETARVDRLRERYARLRRERVRRSIGEIASSESAGVARLEDVRAVLPSRTAMLEFALGDTASLLWVIDRDGHALYALPDRRTIRALVGRMRGAVARPGAGDATLLKASRQLYEVLIAPAERRLATAKNLVIVPDGTLFELPFEALLTRDPKEGKPWKARPFLARSFDTVYAPSASVYLQLQKARGRRRYDQDLLALGDPDFSGLTASKPLAPLPRTRSEVLNIGARVDDGRKQVLVGEEACEGRLKRSLLARTPRILHLATHGLINPLEPAASSVALGRMDGSAEDGYLHTLEILSLPLDVGLVVLSACESARGKVSRGEGVVGLSRAFMASGAQGVVASLWSVSDESTAQLMRKFYERMLGKKRPAGRALNEARLAMIKGGEFAHPFYWSPFIVIGTDRSPW